MPQVNSPRSPKRRSFPLQGSCTRNSQPIQPLKLPPFRPLTTTFSVDHPTSPAHSLQNSALDDRVADPIRKKAAVLTYPVSNIPKLLDRQNKVTIKPQSTWRSIRRSIARLIRRPRKLGEWSLIGLVTVAGIFGGIGTSAVLWLSGLPPLPKCEEVTWRSLDGQRLFCAQETADSGKPQDLLTAIDLLKDWSLDHPLKPEAQRWVARWSKEVLTIAQQKISHNDLEGAVAIAERIPTSSPIYTEAQTAIAHWQAQWQKGEATIKVAEKAIQQKNWTQASKQVLVLGELEPTYWRLQRADALSQQILDGKQVQQDLLGAQKVEAQKLEAQKAVQRGRPQAGEGTNAAIAAQVAESDEFSTELSIGEEALSSSADSPSVEPESIAPDASLNSEVGSDIFPPNVVPEKSFEGYYDERYFENSY